jgi:hypothetical protein
MDAQIMLSGEECALCMGQSTNNAAVKDAQTMLTIEECAEGMGQKRNELDVTVKDAQMVP